jgi:hypothetical protein
MNNTNEKNILEKFYWINKINDIVVNKTYTKRKKNSPFITSASESVLL